MIIKIIKILKCTDFPPFYNKIIYVFYSLFVCKVSRPVSFSELYWQSVESDETFIHF